MSTNIMRSDCRKFAPNIFNKSKCTNCFRQKEEHSAEALESNRATRKVSKCGYLFVAPGWDFSNPLNRTKRWQRRWFVLYDDGELSYSVDEHPDTVPQASIDMNKVVDVCDAEDATGNAYSLSVTAADRVHFVKATCREEYRWWADVLAVFPRSKGRHKRNATFPGVQPISITQPPSLVRATPPSDTRPRFNSCHTEPRKPSPLWAPDADVIPTRDVTPPVENKTIQEVYRDQPVSSTSPPTRDKIHSEDKARSRRVSNRERRGVKTGRSFSEDFSGMLPSWRDRKPSPADSTPAADTTSRTIFDEYDESRREEKLKDIADSLTRPRYRRHTQTRAGAYTVRATRDGDCSEEERKGFGRPASPAIIHGADHVDGGDKPVRGDPDGCGLDINTQRYSPSSERRVDLPAEDLLNIKKGWLMKQAPNQDWVKHWFVLRGAALMYYRDPTAEDKGILDGVIDLSGVSSVAEVLVARNYGFQTLLWDERRYVLSAVTAGIRSNWMAAIRKAAGLKEAMSVEPPISMPEKKDRDVGSAMPLSVQCLEREPSIISSTPLTLTPRSILFSSDEEYRTASEGGRRESQDWGEPLTPLPPSPPLNRTPISRVKEKARSRTNTKAGVYKRSRSSPPSSRRSTIDSVVPDDLILASCGELPESELDDSIGADSSKSSLLTVEGSPSDLAELKLQLNVALREVSDSEQERLKLRHCRAEVATLENQVKELLGTIKQTEAQLAQKTKEIEEVELLRKRYNDLLREHEEVVAQWRQQEMEEDWKELYKDVEDRYRLDRDAWQKKVSDTECLLQETTARYEMLTRELASERNTIEHLHSEVISLSERLAQGIEENDGLYRRVRELEGRGSRNSLSISRERGRSVDSLSDLTNIDLDLNLDEMDKERITEEYEELRGRFEKAVQEIRAMKRELRESHTLYDDLELSCISVRQDAYGQEKNYTAQSELMVARIDDLTLKLSAAEKQVRSLKQKMSKSDSRDKRRSLSLKGRESFQIGKELEEKLAELEGKITSLETGITAPNVEKAKSSRVARSESPQTMEKDKKALKAASRLRRKSLDSATSSEPMKVLIRLSSLESKVAKAAERAKQGCATESGKTVVPKPLSRSKKHLQPVEVNIDRASEDRDTNNDIQELDPRTIEEARNSVECVITRLESVLRTKLTELSKKRESLKKSGQLNEDSRMRLLAEKLAYESVLVSRIAQAVASSGDTSEAFRKFVIDSEILESTRLISSLKSKLSGEKLSMKSRPLETPTEHLTRVLTDQLLFHKQCALSSASCSRTEKPAIINRELIENLQLQQKELEISIKDHRFTMLDQLARALALETLCLVNDTEESVSSGGVHVSRSSLEDKRIRQAWTMAQETVNRELIQAEISHVIMRCGQLYESSLATEQKTSFSLLGSQRLILEEWTDTVEQLLQQEMEYGIDTLTSAYESYLDKFKKEKFVPLSYSEEEIRESRLLLSEFAEVTAQKALIDARIKVVCNEGAVLSKTDQSSPSHKTVSVLKLLDNENNVGRLSSGNTDQAINAEFQFLFEQFSRQCHSSIMQDFHGQFESDGDKEYKFEVLTSLSLVEEELLMLQSCISKEFSSLPILDLGRTSETVARGDTWSAVLQKCSMLCRQISSVTSCLLQGLECRRCSQLEEAMLSLADEHEEELRNVRQCQEQEMAMLQGDIEKQRHSLMSQHEEEQAQLMERARRLERRLGTLDSEYMQQVDNLRAAYNKTLSAGLERNVEGEENIRQRYQSEIEQLRGLCEKGLAAMESSHRRIIAEIEDKHRQELEHARLEKDQALAEETQATLAALDAMRKAHEMEVQKEIAKFKTEFVKRMHSAQDINALHKEQEAEMAEIKQEILSLSEKYSSKCCESASYEEQLGVVTKKLADAQQHILQLDSRNKQLRAHLVSEANELETADAAQLLRRKSRELEQRCEEMGQLQKKLSIASNHGEELSSLCSRLREEYLCSERSSAANPVLFAKLLDKVQQFATTWPTQNKGSKVSAPFRPRADVASADQSNKNRQFKELSALSNAELTWSPKTSCSRSGSPFSLASPLRSPSPSPLSGMVAERKKIFEQ